MEYFNGIETIKENLLIKTNITKFVLINDANFYINTDKFVKIFKMLNSNKKFKHETKVEKSVREENNLFILENDKDKLLMEKEIIKDNVIIPPFPGYKYGFQVVIIEKYKRKGSRRNIPVSKMTSVQTDSFKYKMWSFDLITIDKTKYIFEISLDPELITDNRPPPDFYIKSAFMKIMDFNETK